MDIRNTKNDSDGTYGEAFGGQVHERAKVKNRLVVSDVAVDSCVIIR